MEVFSLLLLGGFTMQSPLITAYVFKGKKRHFAGWLAIVCGFFGPALSVVFNLE
ncbi:hypothetical protein HMPREF0971_00300 [Segatella oris F0302]|uniref:Uncharacterized protein n=1 Tax=Segatella oris F0302 TaxID=649760 RepID=D1QML6_9BACT|nr:hypothetical protein HMPREF0971_00300 [Segatella oris F0302]